MMKKPNPMKSICFVLLFAALSLIMPRAARALPSVERVVLPNRLVLLVFEDHSLPIVTFQLLIDAGSRKDPGDMQGLANLTAKGLLLGTAAQNAREANEELDLLGATMEAECGKDFATLGMQTLRRNLSRSFPLFMRTFTQAAFPEKELAAEKEKIVGQIRSAEDEPSEVAEQAFDKALFLDSPYARPAKGTAESVTGIPREAVLKFYADHYAPNVSILAVGGDITMEDVKALLVPDLANWAEKKVPQQTFTPSFPTSTRTVKINRDITQANIVLGNEGMERANKDYSAFSVMNYIFGFTNFTSRLMNEVRIRKGLAYSVLSVIEPRKYTGAFEIILQTKNSSASEAVSLVLQEMERMRKEPVSNAELELAKKFLVGNFPLRYSTQKDMAKFFTLAEFFGLGLDYPQKYPSLINSVTREDVLRVAQKYLHPENYVLVIVGNLRDAGLE